MRYVLSLIALFCVHPVRADSLQRFMIWHPGETGTTAQAQPFLDLFSTYLRQKIPGTMWHATYFSAEADGKEFIRRQRPTFGIVSQLMYERYGQTFGMRHVLATRPLPHGKPSEYWYLVRGPCASLSTTVFAAEPFSPGDVQQLFPEARGVRTQQTAQLLQTLRAISAGGCDRALVSERVWQTVQHAGAWTKSLIGATARVPVPTPRVVQLAGSESAIATQLTTVLRRMSADPEGQAILTEFRLAGFY